MFRNEYPYTNIHEMNLDWVIKNVEEIRAMVDKYIINYEQITFADPISWEYAVAYPMHTIVLDQSYNAFMSKQDVPSYTQLGNTDYWLKIGDFFQYIEKALSNIAYNETTSATASKSYAVGDLLISNDILYRTMIQLPAGSTFVIGTNIEQVTVDTLLNELKTELSEDITTNAENIAAEVTARQEAVSAEIANRENAISALTTDINNSYHYKTFNTVTELELSAGNVTPAQAFAAMPNTSIIVTDASEFTRASVPTYNGTIMILKLVNGRSYIRLFGASNTDGDYIMDVDGSLQLTNVWRQLPKPLGSGSVVNFSTLASFIGYLTNARTEIYFSIPLSSPIPTGLTVALSGNITVRGVDGSYIINNQAISGFTVAYQYTENYVRAQVSLGAAATAANNSPVVVTASQLTLTIN